MFLLPLLAAVLPALAAGPPIPEGALAVTSFGLPAGGAWQAGEGFVVEGPVLVTTLHWFGRPAGLPSQLTAAEVAAGASVAALDPVSGKPLAVSRAPLTLPNADAADPATDLAAFSLTVDERGRAGGKVALHPLLLASACPDAGALVWVPGLPSDAAAGHPLLTARVTACDARTLALQLLTPATRPAGLGGAPVLDVRGAVVGMAVGELPAEAAPVVVAMAAPTLRAHLDRTPLPTLAPPPPPPSPWGTLATGWEAVENRWGLDLPGLHGVLLPQWGLSGDKDEELHRWLAAAPEIGPIFDEISRLSWADNTGNFERIEVLVRRWNEVYREAGVPVRMNVAAQGQRLYWMAWRVLGHGTVTLGGKAVGVDFTGRLDRIGLADQVPTLLERADDVVIPHEDVRDYELYGLWRRLDPARRDPLAAPLAQEWATVLGAEGVEVVVRTAPAQSTLRGVVEAVNARSRCSSFGLARLPWWGLAPTLDATLGEVATSGGSCARITTAELGKLRAATAAIAGEPTLEAMVGRLQAHLARSAAVQGAAERLVCDGCGVDARLPAGIAAALTDGPTRVTGAARLCEQGTLYPQVKAATAPFAVCSGKPSEAAIAQAWPAAWGERAVTVEGMPTTAPVRWPRDQRE